MSLPVSFAQESGNAYAESQRARNAGLADAGEAFSELLDRPSETADADPLDDTETDRGYDDTQRADSDDRGEDSTESDEQAAADDTADSEDDDTEAQADAKDSDASDGTTESGEKQANGKATDAITVEIDPTAQKQGKTDANTAAAQAGPATAQQQNSGDAKGTAEAAAAANAVKSGKGEANTQNGSANGGNADTGTAAKNAKAGDSAAAQSDGKANSTDKGTAAQTAAAANATDSARGNQRDRAATADTARGAAAGTDTPDADGQPVTTKERADQQVLSALAARNASTRARGDALSDSADRNRIDLRIFSAERAAELHGMNKHESMVRQLAQKELAAKTTARDGLLETSNNNARTAAAAGGETRAADAANGLPHLMRQAAAPVATGQAPGLDPQQGESKPLTITIDTTSDNGKQATQGIERQAAATAAARNAAARAPLPNMPNPPAEQVRVQFQNAIRNGADRINVQLSPASLGRVEVKLEVGVDKAVQAIVYAEKPETLQLLERDAATLQRALEDAGLKPDSNSLSFQQGNANQGNAGQADDAEHNRAAGNGGQDEADAEGDSDSDGNDTPRRSSHDGLLDVEV